VLNTFLQLLEKDDSRGLIIAATNHPDLLDTALFRRFDDVLEYRLPTKEITARILKARLGRSAAPDLDWTLAVDKAEGLSQADVSRAATEALKYALLNEKPRVTTAELLQSLDERIATSRS
jgi:SpoVK/Ycf46/Vps4 family AAA+-type ATPase